MIVNPLDFKVKIDITLLKLGLLNSNIVRSNAIMRTPIDFGPGEYCEEVISAETAICETQT